MNFFWVENFLDPKKLGSEICLTQILWGQTKFQTKNFGSEICLTPKNLGPGSMRVWMYWFIQYECQSKCECEAIAIQNVNVVMNECECIGPSNLNVPVCIFFNV